jgi:hypothetical protein
VKLRFIKITSCASDIVLRREFRKRKITTKQSTFQESSDMMWLMGPSSERSNRQVAAREVAVERALRRRLTRAFRARRVQIAKVAK